jgi:hypothetical protein
MSSDKSKQLSVLEAELDKVGASIRAKEVRFCVCGTQATSKLDSDLTLPLTTSSTSNLDPNLINWHKSLSMYSVEVL